MTKNNKLNNEFDVFDKNIKNLPKQEANHQTDVQVSILQEKLQREKDQRKEERFLWIFGLLVLESFYNRMDFSLLILCLLFLFCVARFLGVNYAIKFIKSILNKVRIND